MGFFSSNRGFTEEELQEIEQIQRNGGINFVGVGRDRRISVGEIREYNQEGSKTKIQLKSGQELIVDIEAQDLDIILGQYRIGNLR